MQGASSQMYNNVVGSSPVSPGGEPACAKTLMHSQAACGLYCRLRGATGWQLRACLCRWQSNPAPHSSWSSTVQAEGVCGELLHRILRYEQPRGRSMTKLPDMARCVRQQHAEWQFCTC